MVFSPEACSSENDFNIRDFAENYGIPEDEATGSSRWSLIVLKDMRNSI